MIHIMTYDFHGGWEKVMDHHAAFITDGTHPLNSDLTWAVRPSVENWIAQGCAPEKMTLGLGSYGRGWKALGEPERMAAGDSGA